MDAVALAKEFAEDCLKDGWSRMELSAWLSDRSDLADMSSETIWSLRRSILIALDSKIIITIK